MAELKTTSILRLNIVNLAFLIGDKYKECFNDVEPNVYSIFSERPIFKKGHTYYTEETYEKFLDPKKTIILQKFEIDNPFDYNNIKDIDKEIIDQDGNIIIPEYVMKNKEKYLKPEISLPLQEMVIIKAGIQDFIESITSFNKFASEAEVSEVLKPEFMYYYLQEEFDAYYSNFYSRVENFIGNDTYHVYIIGIDMYDLVIEKTIDFRIYDWTRRMEAFEWC